MTITKEGALASFYTMNKAPIKHLRVYFSPKQAGEGDPSPDNVREISGWNGLEIIQCGVTLANVECDGLSNISTGTWVMPKFIINNNMSIALSANINNTNGTGSSKLSMLGYNQSGSMLSATTTVVNVAKGKNKRIGATFSISQIQELENIVYFKFKATNANSIISDIMIRLDSGKTFESYRGQTHTLDWTNDIGTVYGGYVDLVTGELVQTMDYITLSDLTWSYRNGCFDGIVSKGKKISYKTNQAKIVCDSYNQAEAITNYSYLNNGECAYGSGYINANTCTIIVKNNNYSNLADFLESLSGKYIAYELQTPITHQLTPTQLSTLIGRNNIWSNADRVEVEYDLAESNDELYRRRNILMRSAPHIETASGNIAHFETDVAAPIKSAKISFSPVQAGSGDPSPENVRTISGWSGITIGNQSFSPGPYTAYTSNNGTYCDIKTGQTFKFEGTSEGLVLLNIYREDGSGIGSLRPMKNTSGVQWDTYTATENIAQFIFVNSQVTNGYVHMLNNTTEIDWQTTAGTIYGGYIDLIKGELIQEWSYFDLTQINWTYWEITDNGLVWATAYPGRIKERNAARCNILKFIENPNIWGIEGIDWLTGRMNFCLSASRNITTLNEFKQWLQDFKDNGNTPMVCANMETPIHYQLSPQALQTLRGTNNIWSNAGPVEIKYWTH